MKRLFVTLSAVNALFFTSCDNENITTPEPLGTVTVNGVIYSDLDEEDTDGIQYEKIPAGVSVYVLDKVTGVLLTIATTTAEGYSFTLQIGTSRTITMVVGDFTTTINKSDGAGNFELKAAAYSDRKVTDLTVVKGATYIQNIDILQPEVLGFD